MFETVLWATVLGLLAIGMVFLFYLSQSVLIWVDRRLNPEPGAPPEPVERLAVGGSVYLVQGDRILDVGRGLLMTLAEGMLDEPNQEVLVWEGKRRIVHSSPTINMRVVRQALGTDGPPALPTGQNAGPGWLQWEDEEDE